MNHFVHNILVDDFLIQNDFYFNSHRQNRWPKQNLRMSYPNEDLYHSRRAKIVIRDKTLNFLIQTNIYFTIKDIGGNVNFVGHPMLDFYRNIPSRE